MSEDIKDTHSQNGKRKNPAKLIKKILTIATLSTKDNTHSTKEALQKQYVQEINHAQALSSPD
jgi:hypothetical protein